jgi:hypothetical protein
MRLRRSSVSDVMPVSSSNSGTLRNSLTMLIFWSADGSRSILAYPMADDGIASSGCAPPPLSTV